VRPAGGDPRQARQAPHPRSTDVRPSDSAAAAARGRDAFDRAIAARFRWRDSGRNRVSG